MSASGRRALGYAGDLFEEKLQAALTTVTGTRHSVGVLYCDINRFKRVTTSLGHGVGDELLRQVAARLGQCVGDDDVVASLHGDHFAVLTLNAYAFDRSSTVSSHIRQTFAEAFRIGGEKLFVDVAIGVATSAGHAGAAAGADANSAQRIIELADLDLHRSKSAITGLVHTGQNRAERLQVETDLRGAAGRGELRVHYQPQIDLSDGNIVGVEALVRWERPDLGMIPPNSVPGFESMTSERVFPR